LPAKLKFKVRETRWTENKPAGLLMVIGVDATLLVQKVVEEKRVVCDRFFNQLLEQEHFGTVDDGMNAVLERLHGGEGLE
jgi:hypothetical protein